MWTQLSFVDCSYQHSANKRCNRRTDWLTQKVTMNVGRQAECEF